ncbi:putative reverse transcriptase domain-containing protein [Tanacetum coccineum]
MTEQGDPLGPLLFALILHPLLHNIKDSCKLLLHAWYLDDGTIFGDSEEVAGVLDIIKVSGPGLGLKLNIKKTEIFWPSCNGMKLREGLFPVDIRRSSSGVKLLGGAVSRDADFISGLAMRRAANAVNLMGLLPQLHDPQSELLLLRSCMGFDFSDFTNKDIVPSKAQQTLANVLFSEMVKDKEVYFDMTMRQKAVFELEHRTILKYRLMIPLFPIDAICPVCRKTCLDSFGEHAVHCKELPGLKYRHDMVRDVLFDICRRAGISAKNESLVNFLTDPSDGRSTLRPADVLVFGWVGRKHACVDLTRVSPLIRLSSRGFTAG